MRGEGQIGWVTMCTALTEPEGRVQKSPVCQLVGKFRVEQN